MIKPVPLPKSHQSKHDFWKQQYESFQASPFSFAEFCRKNGLVEQTFRKWKAKFQSEENDTPQNETKPVAIPDQSKNFIQVKPATVISSKIHCRLPCAIELSWDQSVESQQIVEILRGLQ